MTSSEHFPSQIVIFGSSMGKCREIYSGSKKHFSSQRIHMPFNALFRRVRLHCLTACNCKSLHRHWRYFIHMTIQAGGAYRTVAVSLNCLMLQTHEVYHALTFHMISSICGKVKCLSIDALHVSCHIVRVSNIAIQGVNQNINLSMLQ